MRGTKITTLGQRDILQFNKYFRYFIKTFHITQGSANYTQLEDQIQPAACFCTAHKLTVCFVNIFFKCWGKKIKRMVIFCDIKMTWIQISLLFILKFYWNAAMPTHLYIVYGYFPAITAELSSCNRDLMAHKD